MRAGDDLWLIEVEGGQIVLRQAHSWDVQGGIRDWTYDGSIGAPSGALAFNRYPAESVLHFRYAANPATPWRGSAHRWTARR